MMIILIDGLGDKRYKKLKGRSPLEYANPHYINSNFHCFGRAFPEGLGTVVPINDASLMLFSVLGLDVRKIRPSRGVVEAIGADILFKEGDLVARANCAQIDKSGRIISLREECNGFDWIEDIDVGVDVEFYPTVGHRGVVIFKGEVFCEHITVPDPHKVGKKVRMVRPLKKSWECLKTAKIVNDFMKQMLKKGGGRFLLLRGFGTKIPQVKKIRGVMVTGLPVNKGIGKLMGMRIIHVDEHDFSSYSAVWKKVLKERFVLVHFKKADEAGHKGDLMGKVAAIKEIDAFLSKMGVQEDTIILSDHQTRCDLKRHAYGPIPVAVKKDCKCKKRFSEYADGFRLPLHKVVKSFYDSGT